jgi:hypothetical protein
MARLPSSRQSLHRRLCAALMTVARDRRMGAVLQARTADRRHQAECRHPMAEETWREHDAKVYLTARERLGVRKARLGVDVTDGGKSDAAEPQQIPQRSLICGSSRVRDRKGSCIFGSPRSISFESSRSLDRGASETCQVA